MNRYFDGIDLSTKVIQIKYRNALGESGTDTISDIQRKDTTFTFKWTISGGIATASGGVAAAVEVYALNTAYEKIYVWNTTPVEFNVLDTIQPLNNITPYDYDAEIEFYDNNNNSVSYQDMVDDGPPFLIQDRTIINPTLVDFVVTKDTNSQLASFTIQRYYDGIDLSQKTICIKYINAEGNGDRSSIVNMITTDTTLSFSWLIDGKVTMAAGNVRFAIEFIGYNSKGKFYCWQTTPSEFTVVQGLEVDGMIQQPSASWIQSWQIQADQVIKNASESAENAKESEEAAKDYAEQAMNSQEAAKNSASEAANSAAQSEQSAINSENSANAVKQSETNAKQSETNAQNSANASANSASQAANSATSASQYASQAQSSASQAQEYANASANSASQAQSSATASANSATEAKESATQAANSATQAQSSAEESKNSASEAANSAAQSEQSAEQVTEWAETSKSYAVGETGTRPGEDTDNAKYYMLQAREIVGGDYATSQEFDAHVSDYNNPHKVTTAQIGAVNIADILLLDGGTLS